MSEWQDIASAPDLERIFVCGYQPRHADVAGYWWWHEDTCFNGVPEKHPGAQYWCKVQLPAFPKGTQP